MTTFESTEEATAGSKTDGARLIAVANQKGGVGKTTTAVNLGAAAAELGHRVLIIDLDPQGNASTGLGINPRSLQSSMYDVLLHDVPLDDAIEATRENASMRLTFALSYGGRGEIVAAVRRLLKDCDRGKLDPDSLDEKRFAQYLDHPELPDVDLLIRTGGERRVSNFLLWQLAYAEIHVTDVMWPDFTREDLEAAILDYQSRERRYGRISAQVRGEGGNAP